MITETVAADKWTWLCREGHAWVEAAAQFEQESEALRVLGRKLNAWQVAMLAQQLALQRRARARFPDARKWLWTDRSLQQASDWNSAVFKASLFAWDHACIDACCGAGADLVALAARRVGADCPVMDRSVMGIDCDSQMIELARANLKSHGLEAELLVGRVPEGLNDVKNRWIHLDPDRRPTERRATRAENFSPSLESCLGLVESAVGAIIKLAPATQLPSEIESRFARGWIGSGGQCRQQLLTRGTALSHFQARFAALCDRPQEPQFYSEPPDQPVQIAGKLKDFVFECHPVLHASGLQTAFSDQQGLEAIDSGNGYFTGELPLVSPWLQCFRVLDILPWDQRRLRQWLRQRKAGIIEVKKRLIELDANHFQRLLSQRMGESLCLLVTRHLGRTIAVACQRWNSSDLAIG